MPTCPSCLQTKRLSQFYVSAQNNIYECKACFQLREGCKVCSRCGIVRKLKDFYGQGKDSQCKACRKDCRDDRLTFKEIRNKHEN